MSNSPSITKFEKLVKDLNTIIFGDDDQDVILDDVVKPTISKWLKSIVTDLNDVIDIAAAGGAGANGWTAQLVVDGDKTQKEINDATLIKSPQLFGAKGGANNDQVAFTNLSTDYAYALGKEYTVPVWRSQATKFIGNGTKVHLDSVNGDTTVCLQIKPNSNYSDIDFVNNPNQAKAWTYSVIGSNSIMNRVGFFNFDDPVTPKNSWGILLEDRRNIIFNQCVFGGNGLSDIAIVDRVYDLTINNASNVVDGGVILDIEPNQTTSVKNNVVSGINVNGGHYKSIHILENSYTAYGIKDVNISNASIDLLELRGGVVNITGSEVKDIKGNWYPFSDFNGYQNEYFSKLKISSANLSENLISDPQLFDMTVGSTTSYWSVYAPVNFKVGRIKDANGLYLSINNSKSHEITLITRDFIDLPAGTKYLCTVVKHAANNGADANFNTICVKLYNSSDVLVETLSYKGCRIDSNTSMPLTCEQGVFAIPPSLGVVKAKIVIGCKEKAAYLISNIGLYKLDLTDGDGNFNGTIREFELPQTNLKYTTKVVPADLRATIEGQVMVLPDFSEYRVNNNAIVKIGSRKKYFTVKGQLIQLADATTSIKTLIRDFSFSGVIMGQSVVVGSTVQLGSNVEISATVTSNNTIRLLVVNYSGAINAVSDFNFIVD